MKTVCVDVADLPAVEAVVKGAGPIHLLVNNAGVSCLLSVLDTTPDDYDRYSLVCWWKGCPSYCTHTSWSGFLWCVYYANGMCIVPALRDLATFSLLRNEGKSAR